MKPLGDLLAEAANLLIELESETPDDIKARTGRCPPHYHSDTDTGKCQISDPELATTLKKMGLEPGKEIKATPAPSNWQDPDFDLGAWLSAQGKKARGDQDDKATRADAPAKPPSGLRRPGVHDSPQPIAKPKPDDTKATRAAKPAPSAAVTKATQVDRPAPDKSKATQGNWPPKEPGKTPEPPKPVPIAKTVAQEPTISKPAGAKPAIPKPALVPKGHTPAANEPATKPEPAKTPKTKTKDEPEPEPEPDAPMPTDRKKPGFLLRAIKWLGKLLGFKPVSGNPAMVKRARAAHAARKRR